jgi:hypothetical protein
MSQPLAATGNAALASSISIVLVDALSEALVTSFAACDDENHPLSLHQQRHIVSSCMSVALNSSSKIEHILDLDLVTRALLESGDSVADHIEIEILPND